MEPLSSTQKVALDAANLDRRLRHIALANDQPGYEILDVLNIESPGVLDILRAKHVHRDGDMQGRLLALLRRDDDFIKRQPIGPGFFLSSWLRGCGHAQSSNKQRGYGTDHTGNRTA